MGFTITCNKCGNTMKIEDAKDWRGVEIEVWSTCDETVMIDCKECDNCIENY